MNFDMPSAPDAGGEEVNLFEGEEQSVKPDLKEFSDDDLIEELKARGFEVEEDESAQPEEEMSSDVGSEAPAELPL